MAALREKAQLPGSSLGVSCPEAQEVLCSSCHCCRPQQSQPGPFLSWRGLRELSRCPCLGEVNHCLGAFGNTCEDRDALRNSGLSWSRGSWRGQSVCCGTPSLPIQKPFFLLYSLPSLPLTFLPSVLHTLFLITLRSPFPQIKKNKQTCLSWMTGWYIIFPFKLTHYHIFSGLKQHRFILL